MTYVNAFLNQSKVYCLQMTRMFTDSLNASQNVYNLKYLSTQLKYGQFHGN